MARQNGQYADQDAYDFGPEVDNGDAYQGPVAAAPFAPAQQNGNQFGARQAIPPQDPRTGRFVRTNMDNRQPAQRPQHPLQQSSRQTREQFMEDFDDGGRQQSQQGQYEPYDHPRALLRRAMDVGFSDAEIDNTPSNQLDALVWERKNQAVEEARQQSNARALQPQPGAQQQQQVVQPVQEPDPEINFGEFEQVMDKGFVTTLKGTLISQIKGLKALEKQLMEEKQKNATREQQEIARNNAIQYATRLDRLFVKHAQFLGDERFDELQAGDANHAKREAVIAIAKRDNSRRSDQEKIDFAVAQLFGQAEPQFRGEPRRQQRPQQRRQPQRQQQTTRQQEWNEAGLQRPTNRRPAPELNGVRRAIANVTQYLQDVEEPGSDGQVDYDDFLGGDENPYQQR